MSQKRGFWLWVGVGILIWMAVRTSNHIMRLYKAGGRVTTAEKELVYLETKKEEVEKRLADSQKDDYKERIAREKLGLGLPNEIVVIMDSEEVVNLQSSVVKNKPNWRLWRKMYLGF